MLKTAPAVFAVEDTYQILVSATAPCLFWVRVGEEDYYDESNGIMRSLSEMHRVSVPMTALNEAGGYTVCVRPLIERKPYFTETAPVREYPFAFYPVPETGARAYHISDAHNRIDGPVAAAEAFGRIDFLIFNGDVLDHSGDPSKFDNIYILADRITHGERPCVFSRGNHDLRGNYAEKFAEYTPAANGNTYYTFRLGSIWGMLLDCGEDKADDHAEYGYTVACHVFRKRQTAFIERVLKNAESEFAAADVRTKLLIAHSPISWVNRPPFDIEQDIYRHWCELLKPVGFDAMLCGHLHRLEVWPAGGPNDHLGQLCPVVIGSRPDKDGYFAGAGYVFGENGITVTFTDSEGTVLRTEEVK